MINTILDIDEYLKIIEEIFKKYLDSDIEQTSLTFVKHERYPIIDKGILVKIRDNSLISNKPFAPYMCVACVKDMILDRIYGSGSRDESFKRNPFIPNGGNVDILPSHDSDKDIIETYLIHVTPQDVSEIIRWVDKLYNEVVNNIVKQYPDCVYDIDIESTLVVLNNLGNIKSYRYNELLEYTKSEKIACYYKEVVNIDDYNKDEGNSHRRKKHDGQRISRHTTTYKHK